MAWIVRTSGPPSAISRPVEKELRDASGGLPIASARTMAEVIAESTRRDDFNMTLLVIFGSSALLLAVIGIYGLMAYTVGQRTQEVGIRMAMGAEPRNVRIMVILEGMRLALGGVGIGTVSALGTSRLISGLLFGVKAWDPLVFAAVPVVLSVVALLAVWFPARRAARTDPTDALRRT
jgi:ABC-type antimicrobial peptide transport system permease subunit